MSDAVAATYAALRAGGQADAGMLKVLERISVRLLVSRGCNRDEARDKVRRRLHRLESEDQLPVPYPSLRSQSEIHSGRAVSPLLPFPETRISDFTSPHVVSRMDPAAAGGSGVRQVNAAGWNPWNP